MVDTSDRKFIKAYMNEDIYNWVDKQADNMGMSKSAFTNMCIANYRQQVEALASMSKMESYITQMQQLVEKSKEK